MNRGIGRTVTFVLVSTLLAWGLTRAAISNYEQKRKEILAGCKAERDKLGKSDPQLCGKYPTPEIGLVKAGAITPGATVEVTIPGKYPPGTRFLFGSDSIEVQKESLVGNTYTASLRVSPDAGPERISLDAFGPVCCKSGRRDNALTIGGNFEWNFTAVNGWRIKTAPWPREGAISRSGDIKYMLEFYRGNETTPFTRRSGTLMPKDERPPSYYFSIGSQDESEMETQAEMEKLYKALANPKLSSAERKVLMDKIKVISEKTNESLGKMADPAYQKQRRAQQEEFGCSALTVSKEAAGLSGYMNCSSKVGTSIKVTGTMNLAGR